MARPYIPARAWKIAVCYFLLVFMLAVWIALPQDLTAGWLSFKAFIASAQGRLLAGLYTALIVLVYGLIWARGSFTDGRELNRPVALSYGALWGLAQGLVFLVLIKLVQLIAWPLWAQFLVAYALIAAYTGLFHSQFWDIWVSPPHNYEQWNLPKVLFCHTPNLLLGLVLVFWWQGQVLFLLMQMLALMISAVAMHFPPWWSSYRAVAGEQRSLTSRV